MAHSLTSSGRELPIVFAFRGLDYRINRKADLGVEVLVAEKPSGITCGKEAENMLAQFNYRADSGAHRLFWNDNGHWLAGWYYLDYSDANGQVGDWVCGEATRAELRGAYEALDERKFGVKIEELKRARQQEKDAFERELGV
jgi:hypothetical protein